MQVMVVDDSVLVRAGIVRLLEAAGMDTATEAGDADEALALVDAEPTDVAIVDIRMPPTNTHEGLVLAQTLRARGIAVLVLSQYLEAHYALELLTDQPAGAGYLLKDRVYDGLALADAVRRVASGETVVDPDVVTRLLARKREHDPVSDLTDREVEVLRLVAEGLSNREIASRLFITERTVEAHVTKVFQRLGLDEDDRTHRRVRAVILYLRSARRKGSGITGSE